VKVVLTTGLTGGHLFPALTCGEFFRRKGRFLSTIYVGNEKIKEKPALFHALKDKDVFYLKNNPFEGLHLLRFFLRLVSNFWNSFCFLKREAPDLVIGFGSNLSFPIVVSAFLLRIPAILHEQNVQLGKANRLLVPFAKGIALTFPETCRFQKAFWTGNFLRESLLEVSERKKKKNPQRSNEKRLAVFVMGGSQGAAFLNDLIINLLKGLSSSYLEKIYLMMISGENSFHQVKKALEGIGIRHLLFPYTEEVSMLYEKADLLIARAGAGTISEALAFRLPAIYIPFPHASSHQMENAEFLAKKDAAFVLKQEQSTEMKLKEMLLGFLEGEGRKKLQGMSQQASRLRKVNGLETLEQKIDLIFKEKKYTQRT